MKMAIVFANTDLMAKNVIGVKKDSQATNVMNANLTSLVTTVINASPIISIIQCVKVCLNKYYFFFKKKSLPTFLFQSVYVTLMVQHLWTVMKTMEIVLAERDLQE